MSEIVTPPCPDCGQRFAARGDMMALLAAHDAWKQEHEHGQPDDAGSSVPEAARAAAVDAAWRALHEATNAARRAIVEAEFRTDYLPDRAVALAVAAAAPLIVAAAVAEERATIGRRVSSLIAANVKAEERIDAVLALADEWDALAARQGDWADDGRDRADAYGHAADALRAALASPGEES